MRLAFFGLPLAALLLHEEGHEIGLACISRSDGVGLRRLRRRLGAERVLVKPKLTDRALVARCAAFAPDLVVSWFWTTKLPMTLVEAARLGGIGAHPSLLPRHRGPDPTYWTILAGDPDSGVTVHRLATEYDTGDVLAQIRLRVDPTWNAWQLARALDGPSLRLLRSTVRRFATGEAMTAVPQDDAAATLAPFPSEDALWIRWSAPTTAIERQVRALAPAPGALTEIAGFTVTLLRVAPAPRLPLPLEPGEGVVVDGRAVVFTGDGALALLEGLIHGGPSGPRQPRAGLDEGGEDLREASASDLAALFL